MNDRTRFANWVRFRDVDRPVRWEWAFRADTTELWYRRSGALCPLPKNVPGEISWVEYFCLDRGSPFVADPKPTALGVNIGPKPGFANEVLEETGQYVVRRNTWGTVFRELRTADHRSIPQYVSFAVRCREDFQKYKKHLELTDKGRYPADWEQRKVLWKNRDYPIRIHTHGWYGFLRALMGVEELSFAFFDQPELEAEVLRRVSPLLERGGYIPTLDRSTIPELSLQDYRYYREFLQKVCEG